MQGASKRHPKRDTACEDFLTILCVELSFVSHCCARFVCEFWFVYVCPMAARYTM